MTTVNSQVYKNVLFETNSVSHGVHIEVHCFSKTGQHLHNYHSKEVLSALMSMSLVPKIHLKKNK